MSIIQYLNGKLHDPDDEEDEKVVSEFIHEQDGEVPVSTRTEVAAAFEAEIRGKLDIAEVKYRNALGSVKESNVLSGCLDRIRRRRER